MRTNEVKNESVFQKMNKDSNLVQESKVNCVYCWSVFGLALDKDRNASFERLKNG